MAPPSVRKAKRPADDPVSQRVKHLYSAAKSYETSLPILAAYLGRQTLKVLQITFRSMSPVFLLNSACPQTFSGVCRLQMMFRRPCHGTACSHCAQSVATHGSPLTRRGDVQSLSYRPLEAICSASTRHLTDVHVLLQLHAQTIDIREAKKQVHVWQVSRRWLNVFKSTTRRYGLDFEYLMHTRLVLAIARHGGLGSTLALCVGPGAQSPMQSE